MVIEKRCPNCKEINQIEVNETRLQIWRAGENIQNVWPDWSPAQREQMITGLCSDECWNAYLGVGDEVE